MIAVSIKPLSVNDAWQGRRFKSPAYLTYERDLGFLLPRGIPMTKGRVELRYRFYIKNDKLADADNMVKPLQDVLVKHGYIEDDRFIYRFSVEKFHAEVPRIEVEILPYTTP